MKPFFSVITVCYNAAETIAVTLDSVRAQSWRPLESVVVDGGSKDGTQDIVARYADVTGTVVSELDARIYIATNKDIWPAWNASSQKSWQHISVIRSAIQ